MKLTPEDQAALQSARQIAFRTCKGLHTNDLHQINTGRHKFSRDLLTEFHQERTKAMDVIREIMDRYRNAQ